MDPIQITSLIIIIVSFLPLIICLVKMRLLKKYKAKATLTTASVIASEKKRGAKNSTYYLLDIQYIIHTGLTYSGKTITHKKYQAGDSIPLMYLPGDPGNFKTDFGQAFKWLLPISIVLIILVAWACYSLLSMDYYYAPDPVR